MNSSDSVPVSSLRLSCSSVHIDKLRQTFITQFENLSEKCPSKEIGAEFLVHSKEALDELLEANIIVKESTTGEPSSSKGLNYNEEALKTLGDAMVEVAEKRKTRPPQIAKMLKTKLREVEENLMDAEDRNIVPVKDNAVLPAVSGAERFVDCVNSLNEVSDKLVASTKSTEDSILDIESLYKDIALIRRILSSNPNTSGLCLDETIRTNSPPPVMFDS